MKLYHPSPYILSQRAAEIHLHSQQQYMESAHVSTTYEATGKYVVKYDYAKVWRFIV